jgi:hypothetical protein
VDKVYLIDDPFTQHVLMSAGWSLTPSDAVFRADNPWLIADVYVKDVYWVEGHPIFVHGSELIALDSPDLVQMLAPHRTEVLVNAHAAVKDVLRFSAFMVASGRDVVLRGNIDAIEGYLTQRYGFRWGLPTYRYDFKNGWQRNDDLINPLQGEHDYEAWSPRANGLTVIHPTWERWDVVNVREPQDPPTEDQIFSHDLNHALTLHTAEERAHTMLRLYNRCVAAEQWAFVAELKPWIEREGYNVIDGLGDGDLARLAKREA